jgi:hypothetical protein
MSQTAQWVARRALYQLGLGVTLLVAWLILYDSFLSWIARPPDSEVAILRILQSPGLTAAAGR